MSIILEAKNTIFDKLEGFIKKFYTNELIKGIILFVGLGLLYLIFTLLIEYFLWLPTIGRTILFWLFVGVEILLFIRFIAFPLFKLFKLQKGIDYTEASIIIGNHFTDVQDKLLNFLQLSSQQQPSELVLASIDQKAAALQPIPFSNAVNFSKNKKYIPFAIVPLVIFLLFYVSGNADLVATSFSRIVSYNENFAKPTPFQFEIVTNSLLVEQNKNFQLQVKTTGKIVPENVSIVIGNESYFLENKAQGLFAYSFTNVQQSIRFHFEANGITSKDYELKMVNVPTISVFNLKLDYPSYLGKKSEIIQGTGNAVVPQGTKVTWIIEAVATTTINYKEGKTNTPFTKQATQFIHSSYITYNTDYQISISNKQLPNFEQLNYKITTINDQYPTISASIAPDSLRLKQQVAIGHVSDDYGMSTLQVVFYDAQNPKKVFRKNLPIKNKLVDQFVYAFPDGITLDAGKTYEYYFEVFDNDVVNGKKATKSDVFNHKELTEAQKQQKALQEQQNTISSLQKALDKQDKQLDDLEKLKKIDKQKENLDYKDQKKIEDFLNRQKQQQEMMKDFSQKMKENLENFKPEQKDSDKKELLDRLDKAEKEAQKNEKLLKELEELTKKLQKDELFDKADKLKQQAKTQQKSLEQLVELTKRYYVEQKANQLIDKLEQLAEKQEQLAKDEKESLDEQNKVSKDFDAIKKELDALDKENKELKSPMDIPNDKGDQKDVEQDQQKAEDNLAKKQASAANKNQKSAANKMKQMSQKMSDSMSSGEMQDNQEDAKVLRQILDNLLTFSFDQEKLLNKFKGITNSKTAINSLLKKQQELKTQFKHVDDSLFALAMRQPKLSDIVLKEIEEVHYNLEKAIENLPTTNRYKGISHQQFVLSSANKLADFLSNVQSDMNNANMSASGGGKPKPGKGSGSGQQLSDIIQKQKGLGEKMKDEQEGNKPGQKGKPNQQGSTGKGGQNGSEGAEGDAGKLLEILKQQQELRESLEQELNKQGLSGNVQSALQKMKELEKQLINKGFSQENYNRALQVTHELLKLEKAQKQQGQDTKREANTNTKDYLGINKPLPPALLNYLQSVEILNRQSLPLQPNFNQRVQSYFNK